MNGLGRRDGAPNQTPQMTAAVILISLGFLYSAQGEMRHP